MSKCEIRIWISAQILGFLNRSWWVPKVGIWVCAWVRLEFGFVLRFFNKGWMSESRILDFFCYSSTNDEWVSEWEQNLEFCSDSSTNENWGEKLDLFSHSSTACMHHHRFIFAVEIQAAIEFQLQVKLFLEHSWRAIPWAIITGNTID